MAPQIIPMLPCADIDEVAEFWTSLGFAVTYRQERPNPYVALEGYGIPVHYYVMPGHRPEDSHSTCGVLVDDTEPLFEALAAGMRARHGKLLMTGYPRITRPRPRKNAGGLSGFSLIDPAGNWIRVMRAPASSGGSEQDAESPAVPSSPLHESLLNAIVIADSKGDVAQAAKILQGSIRRADPTDPALTDAQEFLDELNLRLIPGKTGFDSA